MLAGTLGGVEMGLVLEGVPHESGRRRHCHALREGVPGEDVGVAADSVIEWPLPERGTLPARESRRQ